MKNKQKNSQYLPKEEIITIICCGKSGAGKSTLGNQILTNNPLSNLFNQGKNNSEYGLTKKIQGEKREVILPNKTKKIIQYLDIPGVGDPTIDVKALIEDIKQNYQETKINIALMLVTSQDNRKNLQEAFSCAFYKAFFEQNGLSSKQVLYLVFTRCQEYMVNDEDVQVKLQSLADDGLEIDPSRVIRYRIGCNEDMIPLFKNIETINPQIGYNFKENLKEGLNSFKNKMDQIIGCNPELKFEMQQIKNGFMEVQNQNSNLNQQILQNNINFENQLKREKEFQKQLQQQQYNSFLDPVFNFCTLI